MENASLFIFIIKTYTNTCRVLTHFYIICVILKKNGKFKIAMDEYE